MLHGCENSQERQSLSSYNELSHHSPMIRCLWQLSCCNQLLPQMLVPTSGLQFVTSSVVPKQLCVEQCLNQSTEVTEVKNKPFARRRGGGAIFYCNHFNGLSSSVVPEEKSLTQLGKAVDCCAGNGVTPPGRRVPPGKGRGFLKPGLHHG